MDARQPRVHAALGGVLQQQGRKREAVAAFEASIQMAPYNHETQARIAELYRQQRRFPESAQALRNAIAFGDRDPGRFVMLCAAYYELVAMAEYQTCVGELLVPVHGRDDRAAVDPRGAAQSWPPAAGAMRERRRWFSRQPWLRALVRDFSAGLACAVMLFSQTLFRVPSGFLFVLIPLVSVRFRA